MGLRPIAPQAIPILVCVFLIPLAICLAISAGWVVWRNAAVGWESTVYLQYGDGLPPYAEVPLPRLVVQQPYDISVHLLVPASESNFALGNFMASLTLSTLSNKTLASIRRPAITLPPKSRISAIWRGRPQAMVLEIPLLSSYAPSTSRLIAKVEFGRRDSWRSLGTGEGRELTVLEAAIRGVVRYHGVRGIAARFPLLSGFISACMFLAVSLLVLAACVLPAMRWSHVPQDWSAENVLPIYPLQPALQSDSSRNGESGDTDEDKPPRRPKRSRTSEITNPQRRIIKTEENDPSTITPTYSETTDVPVR